MALPAEKTPIIPASMKEIFEDHAENAAWYSSDPNLIAKVSDSKNGRFWNIKDITQNRTMIHTPIAGDIATFSADLLFGEKPKINHPEINADKQDPEVKKGQDRLTEILTKGDFYSRLHEAGETCSALGGVYLKPAWDKEVTDVPVLSIGQADFAVPRFWNGILVEVTFYKAIDVDGRHVIWLVENHEILAGKGWIHTGLYKGTLTDLGTNMGVVYREDTRNIDPMLNTNIDGLAVRYIPNMRPHPKYRGSGLGRSDFHGSWNLMDALDETMSSWIRDIRLGKGRIIVPDAFLQMTDSHGNAYSKQYTFDRDQEAYVSFEMDPLTAKDNGGFTVAQFNIRTEEHRKTTLELIDRIITRAGYSPQSFGLSLEGRAESGTALSQRERRTFSTASKKQEYWKSAIEDVLQMMLQVDREQLQNRDTPYFRPSVTMQEAVRTDPSQVAGTIQILRQAQAASIETAVSMANPDWNDVQIKAEVDAINAENSISMPNPADIGIA